MIFYNKMPAKITQSEFVDRCKSIHNNYYDYSNSIYKNRRTKVSILCPIHGTFEQLANNHLHGQGCFFCKSRNQKNKNTRNKRYTNEEYKNKASNIHKNFYDYSKINYINYYEKISIICPTHGCFEQSAGEHLKGRGCRKCKNMYNYSPEEFISISNKVHKNFYDYTECIYQNYYNKVSITCPTHGKFSQRAGDHLRGNGCARCFESVGELSISEFLIKNNIKFIPQKKFKNCKSRMQNKLLPFDFYIPEFNFCIEYDGEQHYTPVRFRGISIEKAIHSFGRTQENDKIKTQYCLDNNIGLLRIPYTEFKKIEEILTNYFNLPT